MNIHTLWLLCCLCRRVEIAIMPPLSNYHLPSPVGLALVSLTLQHLHQDLTEAENKAISKWKWRWRWRSTCMHVPLGLFEGPRAKLVQVSRSRESPVVANGEEDATKLAIEEQILPFPDSESPRERSILHYLSCYLRHFQQSPMKFRAYALTRLTFRFWRRKGCGTQKMAADSLPEPAPQAPQDINRAGVFSSGLRVLEA